MYRFKDFKIRQPYIDSYMCIYSSGCFIMKLNINQYFACKICAAEVRNTLPLYTLHSSTTD
jgi:hypothetical protein